MRIVAGAWRGRSLAAPPGQATRPTADRVRQALFDMLLHAPWGGRAAVQDAVVLDAFAGTGAMGLEALSRGAPRCVFVESDPAALRALRANIAACRAEARCRVVAGDALAVGAGEAATLAFLDPPYGQDLVPRAVAHLLRAGWLAPDAVIVAETGRDEAWVPAVDVLAERVYGAARIVVFRAGDSGAVGDGGDHRSLDTGEANRASAGRGAARDGNNHQRSSRTARGDAAKG